MARLVPASLFTHLRGQGTVRALPGRVRRVVEEQEERSERLIGWAQLAIVLTFATLYAAAPPPADAARGMLRPVPVALTAYFLFTVARIALGYRRRLPGWFLALSMLVDVGMLLGLIWSFHVQYQQPPAFYLKVPTFTYVFVFIALRALRFDPRFVLSVGVFAAIGWMLMVVYAVHQAPHAITRNFVDYMTDNLILIGAEFDKIFTLLVVTGVLTFAIHRARRTLVTAVREEVASRDIRRFLADDVADSIVRAEEAIEAGRADDRVAAILMLDIRGFTRLSAGLSPKAVVDLLTGFHARILPIVREHGGIVDKFLGDGIMATFGAVHPSPSAAADALRALEAVLDEAERWRDELAASRIGAPVEVNGAAAAGRIVFAALGYGERLEYTVIGEAANLAAKLEKHNKAEGTRGLTDRATYELAREQGFEPKTAPELRRDRSVTGANRPLDLLVIRAR